MFTPSNRFGTCPYDGFWIHSDQAPKASFIDSLKPRHRRFSPGSPWRYFYSLPHGGVRGSLKVMWEQRRPYEGAPQTRIYFNPAVTGYSAGRTLALLSTIIDDPLVAKLVQLDTKVDVEGTYWRVAGRLYMPYVRYRDNVEFPGTVYEGKHTRLTVYQKSGWHDDFPEPVDDIHDDQIPDITRVEIRQRFKKPRPTLRAFLRGELVATNVMRRLRLVEDLEELGDRVLAEEALKRGLTQALREYPTFCNVTRKEIMATRRLVKRISTTELYNLYLVHAESWHAALREGE